MHNDLNSISTIVSETIHNVKRTKTLNIYTYSFACASVRNSETFSTAPLLLMFRIEKAGSSQLLALHSCSQPYHASIPHVPATFQPKLAASATTCTARSALIGLNFEKAGCGQLLAENMWQRCLELRKQVVASYQPCTAVASRTKLAFHMCLVHASRHVTLSFCKC